LETGTNAEPGLRSPDGGRRFKILQIFSGYLEYGGEEGSVERIYRELSSRHQIDYFGYSSGKSFSGGVVNKALGALKAVSNWEVLRDLKRQQASVGYDFWLIHNVFPAMSPAVYSLAATLGVPIVQYLHNYRFGCINGFFLNHGSPCQLCMHGNFLPALQTACWHKSHLQSGIMGAIMAHARKRGVLDQVDQWVAISDAQKREHVAMGIAEERITVIHHFFEPKGDAPPYPERGDVLFVGRLSPEKGVDRLLRAWERVQDPGRSLWIVGDGPEKEALERLACTLKLKNVLFTGFLNHEETLRIWERSACSVVPSIWKEPFGMVVLEAWAKGRPVVAHDIGALSEIIRNGVNGYLVAPDDPGMMAEAILRILNDPVRGASMGSEGMRRLKENFSREIWWGKVRGVLGRISHRGKPGF